MAENQKNIELLNKLAMITEAAQQTVDGKVSVIFEVKQKEYEIIYLQFEDNLTEDKKQFKIEISGTDFIFLLDES
jgi:hypothetical protein